MTASRSNARPRSRRRAGALAGALLLGAVGLAACGTADASPARPAAAAGDDLRTVTATATGTATGVPDQVTASLTVSVQAASAAGALGQTNTQTQALLKAIKAAGIADKDVATTGVSLNPTWDNSGKVTGYQASNSVRVVLRGLDTAGAKLDGLVKATGNAARIDGISLGFQDSDGLVSKARADAVKRSRSQAEEMAKAAGVSIGQVRVITDASVNTTSPYFAATGGAADSVSSEVPIAAGTQDVTVQVSVTYDLR